MMFATVILPTSWSFFCHSWSRSIKRSMELAYGWLFAMLRLLHYYFTETCLWTSPKRLKVGILQVKKVLWFFVFVLSADRYSVITCLHVLVVVSISIDHISLCCQFESTWGMYFYFRNRKRIPVGCFPIDQISSGLKFRVFHATNGIVFSAWLD